jgi:hypothetical protein
VFTIEHALRETWYDSGLLYYRLLLMLKHDSEIFEYKFECNHLAYVRGRVNLWRLYEAFNVL